MNSNSDDRLWAGLAHVGFFLGWIGLAGAIAIYVWQKDRSTFVARHARQAIGFQVAALALRLLLAVIAGMAALGVGLAGMLGGGWGMGMMGVMGVTGGFWVLIGLVGLLFVIGAVVGAVMGFSGRDWMYPVIGEFIDRRFPKA